MSKRVGVEMSDHLSKLFPQEKKQDAYAQKRKRRKAAKASRQAQRR